MEQDIRWVQRFDNFKGVFTLLCLKKLKVDRPY